MTTTRHPDLCIVGCTKMKRYLPARARDLYDPSSLFTGRRGYVEAEHPGTPWVIMSALLGIVEPDTVIEPYDMTIKDRRRDPYYAKWCALLIRQMAEITKAPRTLAGVHAHRISLTVEVHAGADYVAALRRGADIWRPARIELVTPMESLGIGQQKAFYARAADRRRSFSE